MNIFHMLCNVQKNNALRLSYKIYCCYITVDSAMSESQNRFCSYKHSLHKNNQYYSEHDKNNIL
jgi:hypothetical protein